MTRYGPPGSKKTPGPVIKANCTINSCQVFSIYLILPALKKANIGSVSFSTYVQKILIKLINKKIFLRKEIGCET